MLKRNVKFILLGISLVVVFIGSYYISFNKFKTLNDINNIPSVELDKTVTAPSGSATIPNNATIIFKVKSKNYMNDNSDDEITSNTRIEREEKNKYSGMKISDVESQLSDKNYKVISINKSEVVLQRELDYFPNVYVVGVSDGFIAIFKIDEDGNKQIKEVTKKKIDECLPYDQERLKAGIQFRDLEKAEDEIVQLIT